MVVKNVVKNIQTAGYNGARTVSTFDMTLQKFSFPEIISEFLDTLYIFLDMYC